MLDLCTRGEEGAPATGDAPSQTWDTLPLHPALLSFPFSHCMKLWGSAELSTWVPIQLLFNPQRALCWFTLFLLPFRPVVHSAGDFLNLLLVS